MVRENLEKTTHQILEHTSGLFLHTGRQQPQIKYVNLNNNNEIIKEPAFYSIWTT